MGFEGLAVRLSDQLKVSLPQDPASSIGFGLIRATERSVIRFSITCSGKDAAVDALAVGVAKFTEVGKT